jgi:hypothetical protein
VIEMRRKGAAIRGLAVAALSGALALGAAGCGSAANVSEAAAPQATQAAAAQPAAAQPAQAASGQTAQSSQTVQHVHLYFTIVTGGMIGKKGWPEFLPADFTVPANAIVDVEIRDFDDGPATVPAGYNKVIGTIGGTMKVIKALNGPVDQQPSTTVSEVPANQVAHTLTFADNGFKLNVPIPPLSTVEFSFQAPAAGTYSWQCYAACGTDQSGWGGPMATDGWMKGTMTVQ